MLCKSKCWERIGFFKGKEIRDPSPYKNKQQKITDYANKNVKSLSALENDDTNVYFKYVFEN